MIHIISSHILPSLSISPIYDHSLFPSMSIIRIPTSIPYDSNIYLVTGDRPIVIDAGTGQDSESVIHRIRSYTPVAPVAVIATHCHFDHTGGLKDLVNAFDCLVFAGSTDAPFIRSSDSEYTVSHLFGSSLRSVDVVDLHEDDILNTGEHALRVIDTPGHTPGCICLYEDTTGYLISGDTLFLTGYGRTDFPGGSMSSMRSSLSKLSNIDIRGLFPGHGSICERYNPSFLAGVLNMAGV